MKLKYFLGNSNDQPDWDNPHIVTCNSYTSQDVLGKALSVFATEDDLATEQFSKIGAISLCSPQTLKRQDVETLLDIIKDFDEIIVD